MKLSRREALQGGAAVIAASALPSPVVSLVAEPPVTTAFAVGTPGESNWIVTWARNECFQRARDVLASKDQE